MVNYSDLLDPALTLLHRSWAVDYSETRKHADYQSKMHYNQIILVKLTPNQSRLHFNFNLVVFVAELPAADQPTTKGVVAVVPITVTDYQSRTPMITVGQSSQATPTHCQFDQLPPTLQQSESVQGARAPA